MHRTFKEKQEARKAERIGLIIILLSNVIVWGLTAYRLSELMK